MTARPQDIETKDIKTENIKTKAPNEDTKP